jgi:hypothetical protein
VNQGERAGSSAAARFERAIERARAPLDADPHAVARIIAAVAARRPHRRSYLLRPVLSPAVALLLVTASFAAGAYAARERAPAAAPVPSSDAVPVTFVLRAEDAREVALVGDFNEWRADGTRLLRHGGGLWSVVVPLRPGRYTYAYVVDGARWQLDPQAPPAAGEDFGRPSSVVLVEHRQ